MKKLTVVVFKDGIESEKYSDQFCERFSNLPAGKEFCGIWGEIAFNDEEVFRAISATINHFLTEANKEEVIFGCCEKDYNSVISKINTNNCSVETLSCQEVLYA